MVAAGMLADAASCSGLYRTEIRPVESRARATFGIVVAWEVWRERKPERLERADNALHGLPRARGRWWGTRAYKSRLPGDKRAPRVTLHDPDAAITFTEPPDYHPRPQYRKADDY